eukprot:1585996-Amphidinium_carterae.1
MPRVTCTVNLGVPRCWFPHIHSMPADLPLSQATVAAVHSTSIESPQPAPRRSHATGITHTPAGCPGCFPSKSSPQTQSCDVEEAGAHTSWTAMSA